MKIQVNPDQLKAGRDLERTILAFESASADAGCRLSTFRLSVWLACMFIPEGRVISYAGLGRFLYTSGVRAIGSALALNPLAPDVPCHRVVRSDGRVGGYMGSPNANNSTDKRKLLEAEGVKFTEANRVYPALYCDLTPENYQVLKDALGIYFAR